MKNLLFILVALFLISCEGLDLELKKKDVFIIPKGQHSSGANFRGFSGNTLNFQAVFNETAKYQTKNPENQADINKLMGFSLCGTHHHENSVRIGWRWYNEKLEAFAYVYIEGNRMEEFIAEVPVGKPVDYSISQTSDGFQFIVGDEQLFIESETYCDGTENYMLWPYFGGDEKAPQDIEIEVAGWDEL